MTEQTEIKTVLVCYTQATFDNLQPIPGEVEELSSEAAEDDPEALARQIKILAEGLVAALKAAGLTAEEARIPQRSFAPRDVAKAAFGWRLLDVTESNGVKIDLAICLDFPAWVVNHPNKVCWLASLPYFITRRRYGPRPSLTIPGTISTNVIGPGNGHEDQAQTVMSLLQAERRGLSEARRILAGSREIAQEMSRSGLQIEFNPLPPETTEPTAPEWQITVRRLLSKYGPK
jgi:hypothetical protein